MFENPRRGGQARIFATNVPKLLDLKSSSEQIFSKNWRWVSLFVETVFESSFGFTYVLFGAVVTLYHEDGVFFLLQSVWWVIGLVSAAVEWNVYEVCLSDMYHDSETFFSAWVLACVASVSSRGSSAIGNACYAGYMGMSLGAGCVVWECEVWPWLENHWR